MFEHMECPRAFLGNRNTFPPLFFPVKDTPVPRQAPTLQQLRHMYPIMRGNYEKPPWEFCDRRGLFALDCRTDGRWDDIARRYGACLPCLNLLSGKHAGRPNGWMNTAIHPEDTGPHYRQEAHLLCRRLDEANDKGYVAHETLGQLQEDLHKFRRRCETYKALAVAIADDNRPLARRRAARLLKAEWAPAKVLGHLCKGWSVQSWDAQDRDAATLAPLGVGGPKLLQALNNAGYLPNYDTGRRHVEGAPLVRPNEPPSLPWLPEAPSHIAGVHVWHLCIDEIHVEHVITVSREAVAVELCAACCRHPMPLASGDDVEDMAQRLEQDPDTYHTANQATVVFLAPHTEEGCFAISVSVIPTCSRLKAERCHAVRKHAVELCINAAFRDRHGFLLSADTDGDARRSREMQAAMYVEGASTHT